MSKGDIQRKLWRAIHKTQAQPNTPPNAGGILAGLVLFFAVLVALIKLLGG